MLDPACRPSGAYSDLPGIPTVSRWATICRPSGTLSKTKSRAKQLQILRGTQRIYGLAVQRTRRKQRRRPRFERVTNHKSRITSYRNCTSDSGEDGGAATGFSVCGPRQLSTTAICCTQETVHSGAQCFFVKYSRRKSSVEYFSRGMPG